MKLRAAIAGLFLATPVAACDLALVLAVDVSGSVSPAEYRIQRDGLAEALRDPVIAEALVRSQAQLMVMQWTGASRQRITIPWTAMSDFDAVDAFADVVAEDKRAWRNFSTAIGEALDVAVSAFADVPHCSRRVIDISGDGRSNEGLSPHALQSALDYAGVTVNALVIEGAEEDLTGYFFENVIRGPGAFVVTANRHNEYPQRIREKLLREVVPQLSDKGSY